MVSGLSDRSTDRPNERLTDRPTDRLTSRNNYLISYQKNVSHDNDFVSFHAFLILELLFQLFVAQIALFKLRDKVVFSFQTQ